MWQFVELVVDGDESVDDFLWIPVLKYSQHYPVDHLDEVLDLIVDAPAHQTLVDRRLLFILMYQLSQRKIYPYVQQLLPDMTDDGLALYTLLQQAHLVHYLLRTVIFPSLQHLHHTLKDRPEYYLTVSNQLANYFLSVLVEKLAEESSTLLVRTR